MSGFTTNELLYPLTKGDFAGHEFHGNQYTNGVGGGSNNGMKFVSAKIGEKGKLGFGGEQKIHFAELMYGTGSKQHLEAIKRWRTN